jgi:hypothetical protein
MTEQPIWVTLQNHAITKSASQLVDKITTALDWYHQQDWEDSPGWRESFWTGLDILERSLDLPESSLAFDHDEKCDCERKVM